ncbi:MAG: hypothetical protein ACKV2Q_22015 [Planctomycetaceae bacterium]
MRQRHLFVVCVALSWIPLGCSGDGSNITLAPVKGKVTLGDKPVAGVTVSFMADNAPRFAVGETDAEGNYQLTMFDENDGAAVGPNVVTITSSTPPGPPPTNAEEYSKVMGFGKDASSKPQKVVIPEKYADAKRGLLKVIVKPGANEHSFKLKE